MLKPDDFYLALREVEFTMVEGPKAFAEKRKPQYKAR
jgi:hypothetical protein